MNIAVLSKRSLNDPLPGVQRVYVGRPSPLGNPFVIGRDGDRAAVVNKYGKWLEAERHNPAIKKELQKLKDMAKKGPLELVCWCAPLSCHADVIKSFLENDLSN